MTLTARLVFGALIGALFVLVLHPISQPFYSLFFRNLGASDALLSSPFREANVREVLPPSSKTEASLYCGLAARQFILRSSISPEEASFGASVAQRFASEEPGNAFWKQASAWFLWQSGDTDAASQAWADASLAERWDDGQNLRIQILKAALTQEFGSEMAWQSAALYPERTDQVVQTLVRTGRNLIRENDFGLDIRIATLQNGLLIREGGRSIPIASTGFRLMQEAALDVADRSSTSYAEQLRQRQRFLDALRDTSRPGEAVYVESAYQNSDSWSNVVDTVGNREARAERAWASLAVASLPGVCLHIGLLGLALYLSGIAIGSIKASQNMLALPVPPLLGLTLGTLVYSNTKLVWPSLWTVLSLSFFVFHPSAVRTMKPTGLTANHKAVVLLVGALLALLYGLFIFGLGAPAQAMLGSLGVPVEYRAGSSLLLGLSLLMMSIIVFSAPVWALITRHDSIRLLSLTLKELGAGMAVVGVACSVVAAPICVAYDRSLSDQTERALLNEPNLYLSE